MVNTLIDEILDRHWKLHVTLKSPGKEELGKFFLEIFEDNLSEMTYDKAKKQKPYALGLKRDLPIKKKEKDYGMDILVEPCEIKSKALKPLSQKGKVNLITLYSPRFFYVELNQKIKRKSKWGQSRSIGSVFVTPVYQSLGKTLEINLTSNQQVIPLNKKDIDFIVKYLPK